MDQPVQDSLIAEWLEPTVKHPKLPSQARLNLVAATAALVVAFIGLGWWIHQYNFYIAAAVTALGCVAVMRQSGKTETGRDIHLTTSRVIIQRKEYSIADLRGFWLHQDGDNLIICLEPKRPVFVAPIIYFPTQDQEEARSLFNQILAEIEPRPTFGSNPLSQFFKL